MTQAFLELGSRKPLIQSSSFPHVKLLTLGGDHAIALPALRALNRIYGGPVTVLHFDAHLDTWNPDRYGSSWTDDQDDHGDSAEDRGTRHSHSQSAFNHGSMFWLASQEGLINNKSSVHAGLRTRLSSPLDLQDDDKQGFLRITASEIDDPFPFHPSSSTSPPTSSCPPCPNPHSYPRGPPGIIHQILTHINSTSIPIYLSFDIDVVDPGLAPGTGTPEPGGWTSREVISILRGLEGLNVVGADIVEVAPVYDGVGEQTGLVAAQVAFEILTSWVGREGGGDKKGKKEKEKKDKDEEKTQSVKSGTTSDKEEL